MYRLNVDKSPRYGKKNAEFNCVSLLLLTIGPVYGVAVFSELLYGCDT